MDTSMGLSSIASLSLGLSMSMTGTPGGAMMMRNLGVNTGPLKGVGPHHRFGGSGLLNRSSNCLSQSPKPPGRASPATAKTPAAAAASSRENVNRAGEDGDVPRTETDAKDQV